MERMQKAPLGSLQVDIAPFLEPNAFELVPKEEKNAEFIQRKSVSYWQDAWRRLKSNVVAMVALGIILLIAVFAFVGPLVVPYSYDEQISGSADLGMMEYSTQEQERMAQGEKVFPHIFGTDKHSRDILVRTMYASRISMLVGVVAALLVLLIGSVYGSVSGYFGGVVDTVMMRIVEIIYAVPDVLIVLLLSISMKPALDHFVNNNKATFLAQLVLRLGPSIISILIAFALLYWVSMARIVRGQVLQLKQQEFILADRALGASSGRIIRKHLLPNCVGVMVSATCLQIPSAIFLESFLSFLGLGVEAPMTSLGSMASDALSGIHSYPHRLLIPATVLSLMILSFNLFGDGLRDALDPRLKK